MFYLKKITLETCSTDIAAMQDIVLHCHYFILVIKILRKLQRRSLFLINLQLYLTSFAWQLATLFKPELLQKYSRRFWPKVHNIKFKKHLFVVDFFILPVVLEGLSFIGKEFLCKELLGGVTFVGVLKPRKNIW